MSVRQTMLDRKARRALTMVGVIVSVVLALALWNLSTRFTENELISHGSADERLVVIDKQSMVVAPEALGQTMTEWLRSGEQKTLSFELSDRTFQANSSAPTGLTLTRVGQVAAVTKARPSVMVHILTPMGAPNTSSEQLEEQRAERLRHELVASGVSASHITIEKEANDLPFAKSHYLAVLLSK